jgi:hypothetical protein
MVSGGKRPTASQNNNTVSATGGNGNGGQAARYMSGGEYGEGIDMMQTQQAAEMSKSGPTMPQGRGGGSPVVPLPTPSEKIVPFSAQTQRPDEAVHTGASMGDSAGPEVLAAPSMLAAQNSEDYAKLATYLPIYARIAESPTANNATRNFYRWLRTQV